MTDAAPETPAPRRPRRERPKVVRLTDAAAERIRAIMDAAPGRYAGVRVGVKNGGCAGMEYTMEYADAIDPRDEVVELAGSMARPGDTVLLSPGCASLDMYKNYAHRAQAFIEAVEGLKS